MHNQRTIGELRKSGYRVLPAKDEIRRNLIDKIKRKEQLSPRIVRFLPSLLDEHLPVITGCEINDDPFKPVCKRCVDLTKERGEDVEIAWLHREARLGEKLATPDVTIADLIGGIDPIEAASQRLHYSHEGAIHFGIIPRTVCFRRLYQEPAERIWDGVI